MINFFLHLGSSLLVWQLVLLTFSTPVLKDKEMSRPTGLIAFLTGLVFLAHPIQTQAVTYIVQRATSLATFFYLISLSLYVKSRLMKEEGAGFNKFRHYYFAAFLTALMAMYSKEMTMTLPFMILLYELCFFTTESKKLNYKLFSPFLTLLFVIPLTMYLSKSVNFQEMRMINEPALDITPQHYFFTQLRVIATYLRLLVLPINQNLDYDYSVSKNFFEQEVLSSFILLAGMVFIAIKIFKKHRLASFAILWFFITLLPESSIIPIKDVIFEHRLYLPMFGFSLFLVYIVYYLAGRKSWLKIILLSVMVCAYSILTYNRNSIWKDGITLWSDSIKKSPLKARPYSERGNIYLSRGDFTRALNDYNKAIEINPGFDDAYNNRGFLYTKKGESEQAIHDFNKAIKVNPEPYLAYYNRGNAHRVQGNYEKAIRDYSRSIDIRPDFALAYYNRATIYYAINNLDRAIADYTQAIKAEPNLGLAYYSRGIAYQKKGDLDQAILDYNKALKISPELASNYSKRSGKYFNEHKNE
ncbi:MAG: hypothetical protein DRP74_04965 [Candidatus Omnitrophota bacterium]|nr:MAG: hypothetical protein DRP74_04965 [Candidatus Omnitrophota bacterium]